jgi:N-acetylglutamate synthase-like GNAT family acetyltransferase
MTTVRDARSSDNDALVSLTSACPMVGDMTMCVERAPDFFALSRLEGERCRVGVADDAGQVVGCVMASERWSYLDGQARRSGYAGDLKVHPLHRGSGAADGLVEFVRTSCREFGGDDLPVLGTVLAGNRGMERRAQGPRGLPAFEFFATLNVYAIPFLWRRSSVVAGLSVSPAKDDDIQEMAELWSRIAPTRQFAPVLDANALREWVDNAPGLAVHDYLIARRADGRIAGFMALWAQNAFKQLRVLGYSRRLAAARRAVNLVAPLAGVSPLPAAGATLPQLAAVHVCAPADDPSVLRALLLHAYATRRASGPLFFTIALDQRDPLTAALVGLFAQPTRVRAFATTPTGRWTGAPLNARPLYFESALV